MKQGRGNGHEQLGNMLRALREREASCPIRAGSGTTGEAPPKASDIQAWVAALAADGLAPASVRKAYNLGAGVFESAVSSAIISRSPCRGIRLPRIENHEMRFLSLEELWRVADAASEYRRSW